MKTGLVSATILSLLPAAGGRAQIKYAWWLTTSFTPGDTSIESISVRHLNIAWVAASKLQDAELPAEASEPGESVEDHGGAFEIKHDLDGDGRAEKAVVGVYRTDAGEIGRFLLVLTAVKRGRWAKRALFLEAGEAGFSVLFLQNRRLVWAFCMECDSACEVIPSRGAWRLKCHSCCEHI